MLIHRQGNLEIAETESSCDQVQLLSAPCSGHIIWEPPISTMAIPIHAFSTSTASLPVIMHHAFLIMTRFEKSATIYPACYE